MSNSSPIPKVPANNLSLINPKIALIKNAVPNIIAAKSMLFVCLSKIFIFRMTRADAE